MLGEGYFESNGFQMACGFGGRHCGSGLEGRRKEERRCLSMRQHKRHMFCQHLFRFNFWRPALPWKSGAVASSAVFPDLRCPPLAHDSPVCSFTRACLPWVKMWTAQGWRSWAAADLDGMLMRQMLWPLWTQGLASPTQRHPHPTD